MADKKSLIKFCMYYKGEAKNPDPQNKVWDYERFWVEMSLKDDADFGDVLDEYLMAGLRTFNEYDDTPAILKAILFNRFMQQSEGMATTEDFKRWYNSHYRPRVS